MTPNGAMRRPFIAGNWKLWGTRAQAGEYCERLLELLPDERRRPADVGLCVPFTALDVCVERLKGSAVMIFAQTMSGEESGAFTGEVSAAMLTEIAVDGVLLGHSERREHNGETERKLRHQVQEALEKVPAERLAELTIAYEPIWAIGTGKVATAEIAQEAISFIRALVGDRSKEAAERVRLQYGGSVKPENAAEILEQPDVDGALVGGASLDPDGFVRIAAAAAQ